MFKRFIYLTIKQLKGFKESHIKEYVICSLGYLIFIIYLRVSYMLIITPFVYFILLAIPNFSKEFYYHLRYLNIRNINQKLTIINVNKIDDEIKYKLLTFEPLEKLEKLRSQLAIYFNSNILAIEQSNKSKRIVYLITAKTVKNNTKNKIRYILNQLSIPNSNLTIKENDFIKEISFDCYDSKKALSNKDNIAMLLNIPPSNLSIKLNKNISLLISKENNKVYYLQNYIFARPSKENPAKPSKENLAKPSKEIVARPSKENLAKPSKEIVARPSKEIVARPSKENPAKPSKENPTRPSKEIVAKPSKEIVAKPSKENLAKPSKENLAKPSKENLAKPSKENPARPSKENPARPSKNYQFLLGINKKDGNLLIGNIKEYLHTLILGCSGSGKSCFFNVVLQSMMYWNDKIIYCLIDYKVLEFKRYKQLKNTLYISDHNDTLKLFQSLTIEMNRRFDLFSKYDVLDIYEFQEIQYLPIVFIAIDEIADLKLTKSDIAEEIEELFKKLMNKARAAGIIFWVACQRPSHGQIDTDIRANLDSRIAFKVSDSKESAIANVSEAHNLRRANAIVKSQINTNYIKGLFIDKQHNNVFEELKQRANNRASDKLEDKCVNLNKPSNIDVINNQQLLLLKNTLALKEQEYSNIYIQFKQYIFDTTKKGDLILGNQFYMDKLNLTNKQIRSLKEKCKEEGIFISSGNRYKRT